MKVHTRCPVCAGSKIIPLKNYEHVGLVHCKGCRFVFMEQIPTIGELNAHYKTYSYDKERSLTTMTIASYNGTLDEFEPFRKTNRLLDVGCGVGHFLEVARQRGWQVFGTEYSEKAVEIAQKKGISMQQGAPELYNYEPESFDIITSFEVIEHFNNPKEEIEKIRQLLRPGGLFYCTTPNFNSLLRYWFKDRYKVIEYPEHLSYYTRSTLNKVICERGFKNVKFKSTGFSLNQVQAATNNLAPDFQFKTSADEKLRGNIEKSRLLTLAKNTVNLLLSLTNTGMILKGYYRKR
jgi:2-polyprenyl-3-methyl-5-hydroxy-6-metoxy-1,4-benzoquinol methylase